MWRASPVAAARFPWVDASAKSVTLEQKQHSAAFCGQVCDSHCRMWLLRASRGPLALVSERHLMEGAVGSDVVSRVFGSVGLRRVQQPRIKAMLRWLHNSTIYGGNQYILNAI